MVGTIQGVEIAAGSEGVSAASGRPDEALIRACQELIRLERRRIQQEADPMAFPAASALGEKDFRRVLDSACSLPALTIEGQRARAEALQLIGGGLADDAEASSTERLSSALARDALRVPASNRGADAVLVRLCGEFVQVMRAKDELMETDPASPEAQAVSDRARELLDDLLVQRATTPEGHKAQMEALAALGRPQMDYDRLIAEAPDWFGQVAAAILRDQARVMQVRPAEPILSAAVGSVSPYEAAVRMRRAQKLKDQRIDYLETSEDGQEIRKRRWSALDAQAAESVELLLHDLMPLLPSSSLVDATVQVFAALETLQTVDLEPVGGSAPLYRSENVTRIMRCLSSALPVLLSACGQDLTDVLDPAALSLPEAEHGLFKTLWQGSEVMV